MQNNLRKLRQERGMSVVELVARARVGSVTVRQIESFEYTPVRTDVRERIASTLGVSEVEIWPELQEQQAEAIGA